MIEIDGDVKRVRFENFDDFTEAPCIHKHKGKYYLSYATGFPEKISYAMADNIEGPYEDMGVLNEVAGKSNTNSQASTKFKGKWYFFYHNGARKGGGGASRSVCIDQLHYNRNKSLKRVIMTTEGVKKTNK